MKSISSHTQFPSSSNVLMNCGKINLLTELDLTYSSAHHQHNETVDDGTTPEQANLSVVLPINENSFYNTMLVIYKIITGNTTYLF